MNEISAHRLRKAALLLPLAAAAMGCGESPTAPRRHVQHGPGEEYVVRGMVAQGGAPVQGARIVASIFVFEPYMPDYGCLVCSGGGPPDQEQELGRTQSDAEGRFEMTLVSCVGPHVRAYLPEGHDWLMVADTTLAFSCPMPAEIEVNLVVPEG